MSRRRKPFPFFLWHRRIGLAALILVFILSITGIMLNHTESLKLDESSVESDLILNWYGINPQGQPLNYNLDNIWISQWNQQIFFNGQNLFTHSKQLQGIAKASDMIALALENDVLLIDTQGEVIELMKDVAPAVIQKIGLADNKIALLDIDGNYYLSDAELSKWNQQTKQTTTWSSPANLTASKISTLKQSYRGQGLSLERVVLDLHSGRILNDRWGIYIMDASAIMMILLGISGVWVWWSRKLKMLKKKHYRKHH